MAIRCYAVGPAGDLGFRAVDPSYVPQTGEALFSDDPPPSNATLAAVSTAFAAALAAQAAAAQVASAADAYTAIVKAGCQIQSAATPSLNGTYALDTPSIAKMNGIVAGINAGRGLPGGGSTFNLYDQTGGVHAIGSADYLNLAQALENYIYEAMAYEAALAGGSSATPPAQPVKIA